MPTAKLAIYSPLHRLSLSQSSAFTISRIEFAGQLGSLIEYNTTYPTIHLSVSLTTPANYRHSLLFQKILIKLPDDTKSRYAERPLTRSLARQLNYSSYCLLDPRVTVRLYRSVYIQRYSGSINLIYSLVISVDMRLQSDQFLDVASVAFLAVAKAVPGSKAFAPSS